MGVHHHMWLGCWGPWSSLQPSLSLLVEGGLTWTPCPTDPVLLLPQCSDAEVSAQGDLSQVTQSAETPGQGSFHVLGGGGVERVLAGTSCGLCPEAWPC